MLTEHMVQEYGRIQLNVTTSLLTVVTQSSREKKCKQISNKQEAKCYFKVLADLTSTIEKKRDKTP